MIKKIKKIMFIISIPSLIMSMVFFTTGIVAMGSELGIIDIDSLNLSMAGNKTVNSKGVQAILDWAKVIAEYMRDNGYYYDMRSGPWDIRYNDGKSKASCCTTYVSWVLQAAGYLKDEEHTNYHATLSSLLNSKTSEWKRMTVTSESELQAGDILIYDGYENSGRRVQHSNICAGYNEDNKMVYWDAGDGSNGAFKGTTKTHWMQGYNCSYRLVK